MSFFQSGLWRILQSNVNKRVVFDVSLGGRNWRGVRRSKKLGPISLCWYQILGFDDLLLTDSSAVLHEFSRQVDIGFGSSFLQFGCDTVLQSLDVSSLTSSDVCDASVKIRHQKEAHLSALGFFVSWRENMPLSTVITPCLSEQELFSMMHPMLLRNIKKATVDGLSMCVAQDAHWRDFYALWCEVACAKGIRIMTPDTYRLLQLHLTENRLGNLFVVCEQGRVVAGSIVVFYRDTIIYLYGAASRSAHRGAHAFLQHAIMLWGSANGYAFFDHWGSYPTGFANHPLVGVGQFKEKFGGTKIEYVGNYDAVFSPLLYRIMARRSR